MTTKELLARAKDLGITGRHDMTKEDLETAVRQKEMIKQTKPTRNLVKRTNIPWRRKFYFLDMDNYLAREDAVKKAPTQVQLILKSMVARETTSVDNSEMGDMICQNAIADGLKTKITPRVLYAYYARTLEDLGVVFAGYNLD
jgi:hypothetical protein